MAKFPETPKFSYSYGLTKQFKTLINEMDGGNEVRRRLLRFPKRSVSLIYPELTKANRDILSDWFQTYYGAYGDSSGTLFYFFDQTLRHWTDEYVGVGTGAADTFDLHSKTTTAGATLKIFLDGVLKTVTTHYTISTGSGSEGADQVVFVSAPGAGVLITSDFNGYLRIKARFADDGFQEVIEKFSGANPLFKVQINLKEVQW